jgi:hypothetical protein
MSATPNGRGRGAAEGRAECPGRFTRLTRAAQGGPVTTAGAPSASRNRKGRSRMPPAGVGVLPRWRNSPTTHRDTPAHPSRGIARTKGGPEEGSGEGERHGPRRGSPKKILPRRSLLTASRGWTPFLWARRGSDFSPVTDGTSSARRLPTRAAARVGRDVGARAAGRTSRPVPFGRRGKILGVRMFHGTPKRFRRRVRHLKALLRSSRYGLHNPGGL